MWIGQVGPSTLEKWRIRGTRFPRGRNSTMVAMWRRGGGRRIEKWVATSFREAEVENAKLEISCAVKDDVEARSEEEEDEM